MVIKTVKSLHYNGGIGLDDHRKIKTILRNLVSYLGNLIFEVFTVFKNGFNVYLITSPGLPRFQSQYFPTIYSEAATITDSNIPFS